jgi:hypothetical protein
MRRRIMGENGKLSAFQVLTVMYVLTASKHWDELSMLLMQHSCCLTSKFSLLSPVASRRFVEFQRCSMSTISNPFSRMSLSTTASLIKIVTSFLGFEVLIKFLKNTQSNLWPQLIMVDSNAVQYRRPENEIEALRKRDVIRARHLERCRLFQLNEISSSK